jgi:hypothetical protein
VTDLCSSRKSETVQSWRLRDGVLAMDRNTLKEAARLTCIGDKVGSLLADVVGYITTIESLRLSIFLKSSPGTFLRSSIALKRPCFSRN